MKAPAVKLEINKQHADRIDDSGSLHASLY